MPSARIPSTAKDAKLLVLLCLAETLSMAGFAAWPALLPQLQEAWRLSGTAAGGVGGAFFAGYMLAVPFLSGLTDKIDARRVYVFACVLAAISCLGFALFADGALSASLCQMGTGAGLAGTYMPGLKALNDRLAAKAKSRYIAFYTSTFGVGASLSYVLAGWAGAHLGWQASFALAALGPLLAAVLVAAGLAPVPPRAAGQGTGLSGMFLALTDRATRGYVAGYAVHCWELFGLRSWIVALLAFSTAVSATALPLAAASVAAAINLVGIPASIFGNELAGRFGRRRFILFCMAASGLLAWLTGALAASPWLLLGALLLYNVAIMADSAALTAGLMASAEPARLGAALAVYSFMGFAAGVLGPLVFGAVLDLAGGRNLPLAWLFACGSLGLGCLLAALGSGRLATKRDSDRPG